MIFVLSFCDVGPGDQVEIFSLCTQRKLVLPFKKMQVSFKTNIKVNINNTVAKKTLCVLASSGHNTAVTHLHPPLK